MKLTSFTCALGALLTLTLSSVNAQSSSLKAEALLDSVYSSMSRFDHITLEFEYVLENKEADIRQSTPGKVYISGSKYRLELFGSTQLFDGATTYSIIPENQEVVITQASQTDETGQINPSELFSFYKEGYRIEEGVEWSENEAEVVLYPIDSEAEIEKVIAKIDTFNYRINALVQIGFNQTQTTITVAEYDTNSSVDQNLFVFDKSAYESQGYYIIE